MSSVSWTLSSNGSWTTQGAWSDATGPLRGDDVNIAPSSAVTVTFGSGGITLDSLTTGTGDGFAMTGGVVALTNGYVFGGALSIAAGASLHLNGGQFGNQINANLTVGGSLVFTSDAIAEFGVLDQTGGAITVSHGVFTDADNSGTITGLINGPGEIAFSTNGGTTVLAKGFTLNTGAVDIANGTVQLQYAGSGSANNLVYANNLTLAQQGTLNLNGNSGTLSGNAGLGGDVRGGALLLDGSGHLNGLTLDNGAQATLQSAYNQTGSIFLGSNTGSGTLTIASGGTLRMIGNFGIDNGGGGTLTNAGLLDKSAGGLQSGLAVISANFINTGTIEIDTGMLQLAGPGGGAASTIDGVVDGAGTLDFNTGNYVLGGNTGLVLNDARTLFSGSSAVTLATALTYAGSWDQTNGLFLALNNLTLNGTTALDGGLMKGTATVTSNGALNLGYGEQLEGNLTFVLKGQVAQTGQIDFGGLSDSVDQATISAGTTWALEGASDISGGFGTITNAGVFGKLSGAGVSVVQSNLFNTGTLTANAGTLVLSGQGTLGGAVSGSSVLDITGNFLLASGVALTVGELILDVPAQSNDVQATLGANLAYANRFAMEAGTLSLAGHTLTLSGAASLEAGSILGTGTVLINNAATIGQSGGFALAQGGTLQLNGAVEQSGNLFLTAGNAAPLLSIGTASDYVMDASLYIGGFGNSVVGTVSVAGTFTEANAGTSTIAANVIDTGTISISHGEMQFLGGLSGAGVTTISAGAILDLDGSATTSSSITFGAGGAELFLQSPADYAGTISGFASGDVVELNGFGFSASDSLSVSGSHVTLSNGAGLSTTLTFATVQSLNSLSLGVGAHDNLALIHL